MGRGLAVSTREGVGPGFAVRATVAVGGVAAVVVVVAEGWAAGGGSSIADGSATPSREMTTWVCLDTPRASTSTVKLSPTSPSRASSPLAESRRGAPRTVTWASVGEIRTVTFRTGAAARGAEGTEATGGPEVAAACPEPARLIQIPPATAAATTTAPASSRPRGCFSGGAGGGALSGERDEESAPWVAVSGVSAASGAAGAGGAAVAGGRAAGGAVAAGLAGGWGGPGWW